MCGREEGSATERARIRESQAASSPSLYPAVWREEGAEYSSVCLGFPLMNGDGRTYLVGRWVEVVNTRHDP